MEVRAAARGATSEVSGFLNAAFEASLTVKVAGAQRDVLGRLDQPVLDLHKKLMGHLGPKELKELIRLLEKVRSVLSDEDA